MNRARLQRLEKALAQQHESERSAPENVWYPTPEERVQALRRISGWTVRTDPFPDKDGECYLTAFLPWYMENAGTWPGWAQEAGYRFLFSKDATGHTGPWVPQEVISALDQAVAERIAATGKLQDNRPTKSRA
jgi:hypothetical protein